MFILNKFWCHQFGSCLFSVFVWFPNFPINRRLQFTNGNTFAHTSYKFWRFSFTKEMLKMIKWNGREVKGDNGVEIDRVGMLLVSLSKRKKKEAYLTTSTTPYMTTRMPRMPCISVKENHKLTSEKVTNRRPMQYCWVGFWIFLVYVTQFDDILHPPLWLVH